MNEVNQTSWGIMAITLHWYCHVHIFYVSLVQCNIMENLFAKTLLYGVCSCFNFHKAYQKAYDERRAYLSEIAKVNLEIWYI